MTSEIMTIETLHALADNALEFAVKFLRDNGTLAPMFQVISPAGIDVISAEDPPAEVPQDIVAEVICGKVREMVAERNAYAVCNMAESWVTEVSETHPLASLARTMRYNTKQLEDMGVAKRRDAVVVTLETPIFQRVIIQFFYRNSAGAVILREKRDRDSTMPNFQRGIGRFFNFFPEQKAAHA